MERAATADATIDITNNSPPLSILKAQSMLRRLDEGKILEVLCGDRETREDLLRIINKSLVHGVVGIWEEGSCCRMFITRVKKG